MFTIFDSHHCKWNMTELRSAVSSSLIPFIFLIQGEPLTWADYHCPSDVSISLHTYASVSSTQDYFDLVNLKLDMHVCHLFYPML